MSRSIFIIILIFHKKFSCNYNTKLTSFIIGTTQEDFNCKHSDSYSLNQVKFSNPNNHSLEAYITKFYG